MKNILYTIILCLLSTNLFADASQGEMFGLKLGDKYTIKKSDLIITRMINKYLSTGARNKKRNYVVVRDVGILRNIKYQKYYENIIVVLSIPTHTIVSINSVTCFESPRESMDFFTEQHKIFETKYKNTNVKITAINCNAIGCPDVSSPSQKSSSSIPDENITHELFISALVEPIPADRVLLMYPHQLEKNICRSGFWFSTSLWNHKKHSFS